MPVNNILQHKPTFDAADYPSKISSLVDALQIAAENPSFPFSYNPTSTSGLTFAVYGGEMLVDGAYSIVAGAELALTASSTNYIEADRNGVVYARLTNFTPGRIPLYEVSTSVGAILAVTDVRAFNQPHNARHAISSTGGTIVLTAEQARCNIVDVSGALVSNLIVEFPAVPWQGFVRNATSGNYTLTVRVTGQTGVVVPQSTSRPMFCDGTDVRDASSLSGGNLVSALNESLVTISSAATTDIASANGNKVSVTGTTTITALGSAQAGSERTVRFVGSLTLTHNATSLILPGNANIITEAGDSAAFVSLGSGNWVCTSYSRADGRSLLTRQSSDMASATTTTLAAATGEYVNVTGTTTIASFGSAQPGTKRTVQFSGALTLTYNATSMILPGGTDISTVAGDCADFVCIGTAGTPSSNWRCVNYQRTTLAARIWSAVVTKAANYTVTTGDYAVYFNYTQSSNCTLSLPAVSSAGNGFIFAVANRGTAGTKVTIDPSGAETIEGQATLDLYPGSSTAFICDGVKWNRMETGVASLAPTFSSNATLNASGTWVVPAGVYQALFTVIGGGGGGGGGGTAGAAGATGGSASISGPAGTVSATGGGGGGANGAASGAGGTGSGGTINIAGGVGGTGFGCGGGGSGGGFAQKLVNVTPGDTYTITINAAASGGAGGSVQDVRGGGGGGSAAGQSGGANNGEAGTNIHGGAGGAGSGTTGAARNTGGGAGASASVSSTDESSGGGSGAYVSGGSGSYAGGAGVSAGSGGGGGIGGGSGGNGGGGRVYIEF